jgi:hypothetical protein
VRRPAERPERHVLAAWRFAEGEPPCFCGYRSVQEAWSRYVQTLQDGEQGDPLRINPAAKSTVFSLPVVQS